MVWLFLLAYICSGLAGLIYEVSWTRLLTLHIGHTTAAASAVVAAFLGGLTVGAAAGGRVAVGLAPRRALRAYVGLELVVATAAFLLPFALDALTPVLRWAYQDGAGGWLFPSVRLLSCLVLVFVPAACLGATFPMAIRWFTENSANPASASGALYAANTAGAAIGAVLAGFVLIPAIGISGTVLVGMTASIVAAGAVWIVSSARRSEVGAVSDKYSEVGAVSDTVKKRRVSDSAPTMSRSKRSKQTPKEPAPAPIDSVPAWLPALILGISGCAGLLHEIVWTRILSLILGPTTYAFAATLAAVIAGVAIGSAAGALVARWSRHPSLWLIVALAGAAISAGWTGALAGGWVPRTIAHELATGASIGTALPQGAWIAIALIVPTAFCLGAAFPLALAMLGANRESSARVYSRVYAVNTIGNVAGSLAAGFLFIPWVGLQATLIIVSLGLIAAALTALVVAPLGSRARTGGLAATALAVVVLGLSPPWDRDLLSSGAYLYASFIPKTLDLDAQLKAGELLYYRDGASATVSVRRLTGTTTLAVDGKVDASNRYDMINQKLAGHLPLLLHDNPRAVGIVGLGSGVTAGAALSHPVSNVDILEISPEVVEASTFFENENHRALADPRTRLIVGDGRSHLLLSERKYDVIISEPSNPWIAGVAALFTREFFAGARERLAPGGVICQWAHTYNISPENLRSIVATFTSVFPQGTLWLVGEADVLMVAALGPNGEDQSIDGRLAAIERAWSRPGVAADLAEVSAADPFAVWSLYAAGPKELASYSANAPLLTDDKMTLEFSGPRDVRRGSSADNGTTLASLLDRDAAPAVIKAARTNATAVQWRHRAEMMARADALAVAYDDYTRSLTLDLADRGTLDAFVKTAILRKSETDALSWIKGLAAERPARAVTIAAISKLFAARGLTKDALDAATEATVAEPKEPAGFEQLASLHADAGDLAGLDAAVASLKAMAPDRAATHYFTGVGAFLRGQNDDAIAAGERAVKADANYGPVYDMLGAAYTKQNQPDQARQAFMRALRIDAHDSSAYANLGLIELASGNRDAARRYFAEALGLDPDSKIARDGLQRSR